MNLSKHFTLEEMTASQIAARHGWDNTPTDAAFRELFRVADILEEVRLLVGKPVMVSSGYRCPRLNSALHSKPTSQHLFGRAADIIVHGMSPFVLFQHIIHSDIVYDQVILEYGQWVHVSISALGVAPRLQPLTINLDGTKPFEEERAA